MAASIAILICDVIFSAVSRVASGVDHWSCSVGSFRNVVRKVSQLHLGGSRLGTNVGVFVFHMIVDGS